ncbi:MAG: aldehyde dehydrogenase family protein, partial [Methylotenera sp.]
MLNQSMSIALNHSALLKPGLAWLAGKWVGADSGETIIVTNPANGEMVGSVPLMRGAETERAITASEIAQKSWKILTAQARATILKRWFDLIILHKEDLARLLTAEQGKPLAEARGEVTYGASFIEWFAEEARR